MEGRRVKVDEIAQNSDLPEAFTAKLLGILSKNTILESHTGPYGGFFLPQSKMKTIKISEVVRIIDGDEVFNGCGLGFSECDAKNPCPMHSHFVKIRNELKKMMENTLIYDLAMKVKQGESVLIR